MQPAAHPSEPSEKMSNKYYDLIDRYNAIENTATREEADKRILSETDDSDIYAALNPDRADCIECLPWNSSQKVLCVGANYGAYVELAAKVHTLDIADAAEERLELIRKRYHLGETVAAGHDEPGLQTATEAKETLDTEGKFKNLRLLREAADNDYDVIIADITSADNEWELKGDKLSFLKSACLHLRQGGALIFIADNVDALKYKAGILPKHPELLIDKSFAERVKIELGFDRLKHYYPLQNAAFARNIYSDTFMPDQGSFRFISDASFEERTAVYNEEGLYGSLSDKGYFADYAPSYIYVYLGYRSGKDSVSEISGSVEQCGDADSIERCGEAQDKELAAVDKQPVSVDKQPEHESTKAESGNSYHASEHGFADYIRFNRTRADKYAIKTELYISGAKDSRFVRKQALEPAGNEHVDSFMSKYELLNSGLNKNQRETEHKSDGPEEDNLRRDTENVSAGNSDAVLSNAASAPYDSTSGFSRIEAVTPSLGRTNDGLSYADFDYIEGRALSELLAEHIRDGRAPETEINNALSLILGAGDSECHNLDALFENVIVTDDGCCHLIDYEWVYNEAIDRDFLKYRILSYWYDAYKTRLSAYEDKKAFTEIFGIDPDKTEGYDKREQEFQENVRGDGEWETIAERFKTEQASPQLIREQKQRIAELTEWNLRLQDEIEEHKTALSKEREVERLSQNHIRNIEKIKDNQQAQLELLSAQNAYLARHQSVLSRIKRKAVAKLDIWAPAESNKRRLIHYVKNTILHPGRMMKLYLTAEGRRYIRGDFSIGGEFAQGGILSLPKCEKPLVSIVIPAYNQIAYTYACIRSIIAHTDSEATPYELILADDVSTDATVQIGDYISNLIISRNSSNMGFLKNCNQAAAKARGEYIFFLNNDTKVHEDWLGSLVELIAGDETIGMVGSKLVYADGRLQEAGGIIWSDASGWNYGRLDDPEKSEYNYVKDVDYISGAAIMIRASLWKEIGGFDEYFAPAYCEDSDLAFEVRRHGKRVVYQPKSVVTHFEGISNGTDVTGSGLKRYQLVNQEKFKTKWADELKKQSVNTGNPDPFSARDRSQSKPCVAIIDHYVPTWDKDAGSKTTYQYIRMFLKKGFNVKFIGDNFLHEEPYTSALQQLGVEVLYGTEYRDNIYEYFRKNNDNIDFCYLNRPHIAVKYIDFLKKNTDIKCIFYGHDLHYLRILREYELTGEIRKKRESDYWRSVEFSVMEQADMVYYPSEVEIEAIHKYHPEIPAKAITAYVWEDFNENVSVNSDFKLREGLLFVGGFKHPPNADAVKWFASQIMPKLRAAIPDIKFYVAGSGADEEVLKLHDSSKGIEILGFVSDERLQELYNTSRLTVVPLRYGAGVKGKVVEAIYNNAAIITTSVGAEGIPDADKVMMVVDDNPEALIENSEAIEQEFADKLIALYNDTDRCLSYSRACTDYIKEHYSIDAAWAVIADDFK